MKWAMVESVREVYGSVRGEGKTRCVVDEIRAAVRSKVAAWKEVLAEQFGRKMNEDVNENMKLFWKVSNAIGGKAESCSRIKDGNGRLAQGEDEVRRIWKYFEDLYNIDTQEEVTVNMCGFDGIWRGIYFGGEPIGRAEVEVSGQAQEWKGAADNDEITGETEVLAC